MDNIREESGLHKTRRRGKKLMHTHDIHFICGAFITHMLHQGLMAEGERIEDLSDGREEYLPRNSSRTEGLLRYPISPPWLVSALIRD